MCSLDGKNGGVSLRFGFVGKKEEEEGNEATSEFANKAGGYEQLRRFALLRQVAGGR